LGRCAEEAASPKGTTERRDQFSRLCGTRAARGTTPNAKAFGYAPLSLRETAFVGKA